MRDILVWPHMFVILTRLLPRGTPPLNQLYNPHQITVQLFIMLICIISFIIKEVPCSYCGFRYAPDVLGYHEVLILLKNKLFSIIIIMCFEVMLFFSSLSLSPQTICDMNPEKDLIRTSSNAIRPNVPTFLPPSPEPQPPVLPSLQEVEPLESGTHRLYSLSHDDTYLISVISQIDFLAIAPVILCQ